MSWQSVGDRSWGDRPAIIVGAARSLRGFDFSALDGLGRVVAVNGSFYDLPFAECIVTIDRVWPPLHAEQIFKSRIPLVWGIPEDCPHWADSAPPGTIVVRRRRRCDGLSDDPTELEAAGTSGHAALNYAYLRGAKQIYLFGFDYASGGHYCQDRYSHETNPSQNDLLWPRWAMNFEADLPQLQRAGISVINASLRSNITAFVKCSPENALAQLRGSR